VHDTWTSTTVLASQSTAGAAGSGASDVPAISGNGRYVAFNSVAANLVSGDTNGRIDTFVRDLQTNTTTRVSVTNAGGQANTTALIGDPPAISDDGRYVAFQSYATNLVSGDTNGAPDIFVRDRTGLTTRRVSVTNSGGQANGWSYQPAVSGDGRYVAFSSAATNLVSGDTNARRDIFVRDRVGNTTARMSVTSGGVQGNGDSTGPSINTNGRYVAFTSSATNLVTGDTNAASDAFVRDRTGLATTRVSASSAGTQGDNYSYAKDVNSAGNMVLFSSDAGNLVSGDTNGATDVFLNVR
jgi:Tol biopolymer transport system component